MGEARPPPIDPSPSSTARCALCMSQIPSTLPFLYHLVYQMYDYGIWPLKNTTFCWSYCLLYWSRRLSKFSSYGSVYIICHITSQVSRLIAGRIAHPILLFRHITLHIVCLFNVLFDALFHCIACPVAHQIALHLIILFDVLPDASLRMLLQISNTNNPSNTRLRSSF